MNLKDFLAFARPPQRPMVEPLPAGSYMEEFEPTQPAIHLPAEPARPAVPALAPLLGPP